MITPFECSNLFSESYRVEHGYPRKWTLLDSDKFDTQFFISKRNDGEVVICFCASNSKIDWKNNFHFWQKAYKDMDIPFRAHGGFLRCWKEVRKYIEAEVARLQPTCITVTGWSYGGALAILCMEDITYLYPSMKVQCITFGAPRVVTWKNWKKIKERWNKDSLRQTIEFKNGSDIVTAVPLMMWGFHHVASIIHIGQPIRWWRYFRPYTYHHINGYRETIEKISGRF